MKKRIQHILICFISFLVSIPYFSQECDTKLLLKRFKQEVVSSEKHKLCIQLGECYLNYNPDSSFIFLEHAKRIAEKENSSILKAKAFFSLAEYYNTIGDYNLSIENTITALQFFEETENDIGVIDGNTLLGHNYTLREEYTSGLKYYDESIKRANMSGKEYQKIAALIGKGNIFSFIDSLELASKVFEEAIVYIEKYNSGSETSAVLYNNTGNIYMSKQEYLKAIENYTKAYNIHLENNDKFRMSLLSYNMSESYLGIYRYDSALKYCEINLLLAQELKNNEEFKFAYEGFYKMYQQKLEYDSAFKYYKLFISYKDSIRDDEYNIKVDALVNKYTVERQEKELIAANDQVVQGRIIQKQSKRIINLLIIVGVFLFVLLILFFLMYQRSQKFNQLIVDQSKVISDKNKSIDKALIQKDILIKEVHHRVKNNLQIMGSLLNLQTKKLKNKVAIQAIEDSKSRVQAIALMHKSLYQDDDFNSVDLKAYFDSLIESYQALFVSEINNLSFDVQVARLMVSTSTAVPLGLILSELISNSLKHAFTDSNAPKITLSLVSAGEYMIIGFADNGVGVKDDFDIKSVDSLGFEIITALTEQIDGEITILKKVPFSLSIRLLRKTI